MGRTNLFLSLVLMAVAPLALAKGLSLPGLEPRPQLLLYANKKLVVEKLRSAISEVSTSELIRRSDGRMFDDGYYVDKTTTTEWNPKSNKYEVTRSRCEDDRLAMSAHRGWARLITGMRLFAEAVEGKSGEKPLNETAFFGRGRDVLWKFITVDYVSDILQDIFNQPKMSLGARTEIVDFLRVLSQAKQYHQLMRRADVPECQWDKNNRKPVCVSPMAWAESLVAGINSKLPSSENKINPCFEGYVEHTLKTGGGRSIPSESIYSGGLANYAIGFWERREGDGTSKMADAMINYAIHAFEN